MCQDMRGHVVALKQIRRAKHAQQQSQQPIIFFVNPHTGATVEAAALLFFSDSVLAALP